jgi:diguanylate cyclase (GGDEF)-like protein
MTERLNVHEPHRSSVGVSVKATRTSKDPGIELVIINESADPSSDSPTPARLMSLAQRGQHAEAIAQADELLMKRSLPAEDKILTLYALAIALLFTGRRDEALQAANDCYEEASLAASVGWKSNALAMRAQVHAANGEVDAALTDLVEAEILMEACVDLGLRNWAHAALGTAYTSLRLFELALPHFELAPTIPDQPVDLPDGPTIDIANLADLHLRWATELERVGLDLFHSEHDEHLAAARLWISEGEELDRITDDDLWSTVFKRMRHQAESAFDPATVVDALAEQTQIDLEAGRLDDAIQGHAHRSRALRLLEHVEEAVEEAQSAVALLTDEVEVTTRLNAYHQLHEAQCAAEIRGSADVRSYILINAALLWQQRIRSVEAVKARRDFAVLEAQHEFSSRLAREDALTGAYNRRALDEWLEAHPAGPATLVMIDLDQFKQINDAHGHSVGDEVLIRVAQTLVKTSRAGDVIARIGGDEFVIAIEGGITTTYELCRRIEASIAATDLTDLAAGLQIAASIGAASVAVGQSTGELLKRADKDMLESKRAITSLSASA